MTKLNRLAMFIVAAVFLGLLGPASAHPPPELADFVGARAGQAEGGLNQLGYQNVSGSYWWNASEGLCVHMPISQGRFSSVDIVKPSSCGKKTKASSNSGAAAAGLAADEFDMMAQCNQYAAKKLGLSTSDIANVTYEGTRTDGSHAVNGTTTAGQSFQCSFDAAGTSVVGWTGD